MFWFDWFFFSSFVGFARVFPLCAHCAHCWHWEWINIEGSKWHTAHIAFERYLSNKEIRDILDPSLQSQWRAPKDISKSNGVDIFRCFSLSIFFYFFLALFLHFDESINQIMRPHDNRRHRHEPAEMRDQSEKGKLRHVIRNATEVPKWNRKKEEDENKFAMRTLESCWIVCCTCSHCHRKWGRSSTFKPMASQPLHIYTGSISSNACNSYVGFEVSSSVQPTHTHTHQWQTLFLFSQPMKRQ